ncbi:MAG: class I SAM-dependent methyltransferase [Sphingobacteriales bacterium]|nr:MAG: class I SAM-dependent methyltransferase [Sphingobacteriales bacterium]
METLHDYININRELWNEKTGHHLKSDFYDVAGFKEGVTSLQSIETALIGDVSGKKVLHLQCHFGQDTLSLARLGAEVTGIDLSDKAIQSASELASELNLKARFICSDVYAAPDVLDETFDMVFTTYGVLGWLPDMQRWADVVSRFLKPGGKLILVEFHPVMWMFDNDMTHIQYSYFNKEVIVDSEEGTYADRNAPMKLTAVSWNHNLAEVMQALINAGLQIEQFAEYESSPYNCVANMVTVGEGQYQIKGLEGKIPLVYSVLATKK